MRHMHTLIAARSPKLVRSYTSMVCMARRQAKSLHTPTHLNYVRSITVRTAEHSAFPQCNHGEEDVAKAAERVRKSIEMPPGLHESQVQNFRHLVQNAGHVSQGVSTTLLSCFGSCLYNVHPKQRTNLLQETWHMLRQNTVFEVGHYNTLLKVYVENGHNFTPTDIITEMQAHHIIPNMDTYENLMEHYCNHGDVQAATTVMNIMKECGFPIKEKVYSFLITGFFKSGDTESARDVLEQLRQASLTPSVQSYTALMCGYAQQGDMAAVKQLLSETPDRMINSRSVMKAVVTMVMAGHSQHVDEMIKMQEAVTDDGANGLMYVSQLVAHGFDDDAYKLFHSLYKQQGDPNYGRCLLQMFVQLERPLDSVMQLMERLKADNMTVDDISDVASTAIRMGKTDYAVAAIEMMKSLNLPVRTHYFWPAFCQYRDKGDKQGVITTAEKMVKLCDTRSDQLQTYLTYIYPALKKLGEPRDWLLTLPVNAGFRAEDVNFVNMVWILDTEGPEAAWDYAKDKKVHGNIKIFRRIASKIDHVRNLDSSWEYLFKVILHGFQGANLEKVTSHVLQEIINANPGREILGKILGFVTENNMLSSHEEQSKLVAMLQNAPASVTEKLVESRGLSRHLTLNQEEECSPEQGHNVSFPVLQRRGHQYATQTRDVHAALQSLDRIEVMYPERSDYHGLVLAVAHLLIQEGQQDEALVRLGNYSDKWRHQLLKTRTGTMRADCSKLVKTISSASYGARLVESLVYFGYLDTAHPVLNTYMEALLNSKYLHEVTEGVMYTASKYSWIPKLNDVILWLITTGETQALQTVVDTATGLLGQQEAIVRLIEGFLRCGQHQKVSKLLKDSGAYLENHRMRELVHKLVKGLRITELEGLVEAAQGVEDLDRRILMSELIRCYGNLHDEDAALSVWERCQEEGVPLEPASLHILSNYLQAVDIPVPFPVPPVPSKQVHRFEDVADEYLFHCIVHKQWENITESLKSLTPDMFFKLVDKIPGGERAVQATQRIAFHLGEVGNIDTLRAIDDSRAIRKAAVENVKRALFCAYIHRERHDELVWHLKQRRDMLASYLSSHGLSLLKEKSQYHYGEVVSMIHRQAMSSQLKPAGILWVHYFITSSPEADQLLQMYRGLNADLPLGFVFSHIRFTNEVELIPSLVNTFRSKHKLLLKAYDHCLSYHYSNRDLDAMMTAGRQLQEAGIRSSQLTRKYVRYVDYHCRKNNIASPFDRDATKSISPNNSTNADDLSSESDRDADVQ
ncbi:leucine-rich PPR motif-containing protein, mitochondrial-like [Haliotis cracherodii]|uniref:leucine-rich PPR motif-containing protein, mitochondrial-like n=1 Tax=Haliotis cracherodii TaxID=6455 RepID=UPI0039E95776